ncbi:MAG: GAF domain-containing sensor histidine kinase [Ramlibacter sp.]|nr:GAF domain-containing sensor histidine kinase [Ramlibacter sp.]
MTDSEEAIARDVAAVGRIGAVPALLRVVCQITGMGFAAVARVTESTWTACAVQDDIEFGIMPGDQLGAQTTLCIESRAARQPVVIDHASQDPVYCSHPTPRMYKIESYISVPIMLKDGSYFGNLCAFDPRPARVSDPKIVDMFILFAELISLQLESETRQLAAESALRNERATAELREQFIAVLGHDLRNPLMAVSATAELLEITAPNAELAALGLRLQGVARRMSRLIDDVMDFARGRLGAGMGLTLTREDNLASALRDVVAELRDANPGRTIIDSFRIDAPVDCDRGRVQQLLSNLVGNALAHGAQGRAVRVEARIEDGILVLSVANEGRPIEPQNLDKVFQPYWRPSDSKPGGGLGLGLYICCEIAKAHGGRITVNSSAQEGTRFAAHLPVAPARPG